MNARTHGFRSLTPDRVIDLVEEVMETRALPVCRPLTSYINRVYEVLLEDGEGVVVKFYRPGRWTPEALEEEHAFVFDLEEAGVPVVAPFRDAEGNSLFEESDDLWCAVFPRRRGRPFEDQDPEGWQELGRTLARMHQAGDESVPAHRLVWHPHSASQLHLDFILHCLRGDAGLCRDYERAGLECIDAIAPLFREQDYTRIHGDMHPANLMRRPDTQGILLIDFDDMAYGPPVQDMWMLLPDTVENCPDEIEHLLYGYRQLRAFDPSTLDWVEPLRAMRFLHFTAWCAQQSADRPPGSGDDLGSPAWWRRELNNLLDQRERIREMWGV